MRSPEIVHIAETVGTYLKPGKERDEQEQFRGNCRESGVWRACLKVAASHWYVEKGYGTVSMSL